jgi:hypothetical protein
MEIDESIVLLGEELDAWWEEFSPMLDSEDRGAQAETLLRGFEIAKRFDSFKTQGLAAVKALLDRQDTTEHAGLASQIQAFAFAAKLANTLHDQFRDIDGETQVARLTEAIVKALERTATGRAALAERGDVLDAAGGTDIFQMPAGRVKITTGVDAVRCLRLSDKAKILRWYADCCRTPIANTAAGPRFPVVALIHHERDGRCRGEMLGPPLCRICEHSATGPLPANAAPLPSFGVFVCRAAKLLGWWGRGLGQPNPFFDDFTGAPLSVPRVLAPSERAAF